MTLTAGQLTALLPIVLLAAAAIVVMLLAAFLRRRDASAAAATIGLAVTLLVPLAWRAAPQPVTPLLLVDRAALLYTALLGVATLGAAGLAVAI